MIKIWIKFEGKSKVPNKDGINSNIFTKRTNEQSFVLLWMENLENSANKWFLKQKILII